MNEIIDKEPEVVEQDKVKDNKTYKVQSNNFKKPVTRITKMVQSSAEVKRSPVADPLIDRLPPVNLDNASQPSVEDATNMQVDESGEFINKASLGPGLILKNTRIEAKLTREDVAKELRLAVRHIDCLENDNFEKFTAMAFYIGYLRNYARLLELDSDKLVTKFYAVYKVMPEKIHYKQLVTKTWHDTWPMKLFLSKERKQLEKVRNVKLFVFGSVIAVVFLCLWWMLSNSSHETENLKIGSLPPEAVDHLIPSQPVIAQNSTDNTNTNTSNASVNTAANSLVSQSVAVIEHTPSNELVVASKPAVPSEAGVAANTPVSPRESVVANSQDDKNAIDKFSKRSKLDDIS